ncbi:hypothetical protein QBC38DRAFT_463722 [Podospora fimiseda]|uniref:RING-type domain-containing protein n=1 Tax=Podospora fimiseda TaxID=252190 RepID=A0AAN7BZ31_9PEZI|nr:hypothetical protein QBC38DRAFT_463722 [Podospora fimiseda]
MRITPGGICVFFMSIVTLTIFFVVSLRSYLHSDTAVALDKQRNPTPSSPSALRNFFSLQSPFTLFPPNAVISLFEDNSTFFPARPAAFGPEFPWGGLSGQLWTSGGFSDDHLQEGEGQGELGCGDIPGWEDGRHKVAAKGPAASKSTNTAGGANNMKRRGMAGGPAVVPIAKEKRRSEEHKRTVDDGTDDYLHEDLEQSHGSYRGSSTTSGHADIQSMQETAEITGKIALLSRGGCGFLEKVKWAQRRGAIALIVGDNQKGGPLIQMFARGNVDNVTIPSVFTSRTTAMLLSSLMQQPGRNTGERVGNPIKRTNLKNPGLTTPRKANPKEQNGEDYTLLSRKSHPQRRSWLSNLFHWGDSDSTASDRSRPPSSGRLDWVLVDDWSDEKDKSIKSSLDKASSKNGAGTRASSTSDSPSEDGFQIGVQDWRDPDLVESSTSHGDSSSSLAKDREISDKARSGQQVDNSESNDATESDREGADDHEGLWVTITPTTRSSTFLDTIMVLIVSPLITLTVVYALLMIRATFRRRRWRAPKSIVAQLPVHIYHPLDPAPTWPNLRRATSRPNRLPAPSSTSPLTPLLQAPEQSGISDNEPIISSRQVDCVICLEEYIAGVSRVMRLPCGHEFHKECITPWLILRRRTCPICKGDVVAALAAQMSEEDSDIEDELERRRREDERAGGTRQRSESIRAAWERWLPNPVPDNLPQDSDTFRNG